jgi:hypothetical protein
MVAIAKAKARRRHEEAIQRFQDWDKKHPDATKRMRVQQFDMYVDSADLAEKLNANRD